MNILLVSLSILGGALIGSSASPFFAAALQPRDKYSAAPALICFGIVLVLTGAALLGFAVLITKAAS